MDYFPFELAFSQMIQSYSNIFFDLFFFTATQLGNPLLWLLLSAWFFWKGEERKSFFLMTTILIASVFVGMLKPMIARLRPSGETVRIFFPETDSIYGIPSGHATIVSSVFAFYEKNLKKFNKLIFVLGIFLVLISRIYLGNHFLLDVIAGLALGLIIGKGVYFLDKIYEHRELHSKKLLEEIGLLGSIALLIVLILLEQHPFATLIIGYFTGIFFFKLIGMNSSKLNGNKLISKQLIGFILLALIMSSSYFLLQELLQRIGFFIAGFFVSFIYPAIWELKKK
ncbi:MAG: phosphatase PAP2 family protein [Candidatus Diapherotrites archaeon]|nr:phosphatase PAP2 family protein [Candidatus Diapherotrites archaeon]